MTTQTHFDSPTEIYSAARKGQVFPGDTCILNGDITAHPGAQVELYGIADICVLILFRVISAIDVDREISKAEVRAVTLYTIEK